jgi:UDP-galactopyranose mutase
MKRILIIGAGLSGLTLARLFKDHGDLVDIVEKEVEIGGMCRDYKYKGFYPAVKGPHILHFRKETTGALRFIKKYTALIPFNHKVICLGNSNFTFWPPNAQYLELFNSVNKHSLSEEFVDSYSKKVWGDDYEELKDTIHSRFKFKSNSNTYFFEGQKTFMPAKGYSTLFRNLVNDMKVVKLKEFNVDSINKIANNYDFIFNSSPIDEFFKKKFGDLGYVRISFAATNIINNGENILLSPVMNLNTHPKIIRITEYNQFYDNKNIVRVIGREYKDKNGDKIYPILTKKNLSILEKYKDYSKKYPNMHFIGRLGTYSYLNMDDAVQNSLNLYNKLIVEAKK